MNGDMPEHCAQENNIPTSLFQQPQRQAASRMSPVSPPVGISDLYNSSDLQCRPDPVTCF